MCDDAKPVEMTPEDIARTTWFMRQGLIRRPDRIKKWLRPVKVWSVRHQVYFSAKIWAFFAYEVTLTRDMDDS